MIDYNCVKNKVRNGGDVKNLLLIAGANFLPVSLLPTPLACKYFFRYMYDSIMVFVLQLLPFHMAL